jgi:topoisomerase IA-like protein
MGKPEPEGMNMSKRLLIAMVATAVMVEGERVVVPAGSELPPDLSEHDANELLASRAAKDPAKEAAQERKDQRAAAAAQDAFDAERDAVQKAQASTKSDAKAGGKNGAKS